VVVAAVAVAPASVAEVVVAEEVAVAEEEAVAEEVVSAPAQLNKQDRRKAERRPLRR
jgi:hypothetical protein